MFKIRRGTKKFSCIVGILRLGGLPPLFGFVSKWLILEKLVILGRWGALRVLLARRLLTLYFYLRIL